MNCYTWNSPYRFLFHFSLVGEARYLSFLKQLILINCVIHIKKNTFSRNVLCVKPRRNVNVPSQAVTFIKSFMTYVSYKLLQKRFLCPNIVLKTTKKGLQRLQKPQVPFHPCQKTAISLKKRTFHCLCSETKNTVMANVCIRPSWYFAPSGWQQCLLLRVGFRTSSGKDCQRPIYGWPTSGFQQGTLLMEKIWTFIDSNLFHFFLFFTHSLNEGKHNFGLFHVIKL